jgi:Domain of unknown function (DUF362)
MGTDRLSRRSFLELCGAGALAGSIVPLSGGQERTLLIDSPAGRRRIDTQGSPIGVVRLDVSRSYADVGALLQRFIDQSDEAAWRTIRDKIDYTFDCLDLALGSLERETRFRQQILPRLNAGQKLLFKPNLVGMLHIDPQTHGPGRSHKANTEWAMVAALMRWFHDKLGISYYQMALGEASTSMTMVSHLLTRLNPEGKPITPEGAIEGRSGKFYGGWGFYFVRKYLAESLRPGATDDPRRGYEESVRGVFVAPGDCRDKLMVYDLNQAEARARRVRVPNGVNFQSITLHKAIVGGEAGDRADRAAYPGCVLVNVPKFKVHQVSLMTNLIKNLGIGLYPMHAGKQETRAWDYSLPHGTIPGIKGGLPHTVWVSRMDPRTGIPQKDASGKYLVDKTGGINATMLDVLQAVKDEGVLMLHVVDGIEAINLDHTGPGEKVAEGIVFAGLDPVATDLLSARYMFSNVPMRESLPVDLDDGFGGRFPQRVPVPAVEQGEIVTKTGFDCPIARDSLMKRAEERGFGRRRYYVVGQDVAAKAPLASIDGHLGRVVAGRFEDICTSTLYYALAKTPWDLQKTVFGYFRAVDQLTGSKVMDAFLEAYDENGDGTVTYDEFGRNGAITPLLFALGRSIELMGTEPFGFLKGPFLQTATRVRWANAAWNGGRHDLLRPFSLAVAAATAFAMSRAQQESPDPGGVPKHWGNGKWPGFALASRVALTSALFGRAFPAGVSADGLYALALSYADLTQNKGKYSSSPDGLVAYVKDVTSGAAKPLDFVFYVPREVDVKLPNVVATADAEKILTASFSSGQEVWA